MPAPGGGAGRQGRAPGGGHGAAERASLAPQPPERSLLEGAGGAEVCPGECWAVPRCPEALLGLGASGDGNLAVPLHVCASLKRARGPCRETEQRWG